MKEVFLPKIKKNGREKADMRKRKGFLLKVVTDFREGRIFNIIGLILLLVLAGGGGVFIVERTTRSEMFRTFLDSIWWGIVTITTVGYGDKFPLTAAGRVIASMMMLLGLGFTAVLSGTIASIFVDRKLKEGRGLQELSINRHTVVCGWNENAMGILDNFQSLDGRETQKVVLINEMNPEDFQIIQTKYPSIDLKFVRGDFTKEQTLVRAALERARSAIVIPDTTGKMGAPTSDERTILCVLAVKSLNPGITTCAEIIDQQNAQHLRRANVDDIIINGEFSGFLLANASHSRGIPAIVREMLTPQNRHKLRREEIPAGMIGKTFLDLSAFLLKDKQMICVGIYTEEEKMSLESILSDDPSGIDSFIRRKFVEAEIDIKKEASEETIHLNPGPDYVIREGDRAFVV